MAKMILPEYEKRFKKKKKSKPTTPFAEAWKRLRRNKLAVFGMCFIGFLIFVIIFADLIYPVSYSAQDYGAILQTPTAKHILGTDHLGRDILSRIIYGARISLPISLCCVGASILVGGGLGMIAAYKGGWLENLVMRFMDILQSIPHILFAIAIIAALGNGVPNLVLAMAISSLPGMARITRAAIYTVRDNEYVLAAKTIGASGGRQMLKYMIPNALGPIIVSATFSVAQNILIISTLSYLGLGIVPPTPEWGSMLAQAKDYIRNAPHTIIFPGIAIALTVFSINVFGDGLRDALDPRLK